MRINKSNSSANRANIKKSAPREKKSSLYKQAAPGEKKRIEAGYLMTVNEVMRDVSMSYSAVIKLIKRGDVRVLRVGNGFRILSDSLLSAANCVEFNGEERENDR